MAVKRGIVEGGRAGCGIVEPSHSGWVGGGCRPSSFELLTEFKSKNCLLYLQYYPQLTLLATSGIFDCYSFLDPSSPHSDSTTGDLNDANIFYFIIAPFLFV